MTAAANGLGVGTYAAIVNFTNWNTHVVQRVPFTLLALQPLLVQPATGFTAAVAGGVPTGVTTQNFSLTNSGSAILNWTLINTSAWLMATGGGTLAAGATTTATASLSPAATNLATGSYTATVWFTNQTSGGAQSLQFALQVNQSPVQNGGFETGDFTGWTLSGPDTNDIKVVTAGGGISPHSGNYFAELGTLSTLGYLSQTLQTFANQSYLLSLWFNCPIVAGGNTPNEFSVSWNGNMLFDRTNMPHTSGWTNLQFVVTAIGASSVLQFGERDDPWYLGLDDVSLKPIPAVEFQPATVMVTNENLKFAWTALTGLVYQVQFKTDLLQTNWDVLKNIPSTNTIVTFVDTNPITGSPQKFYRLLLLP